MKERAWPNEYRATVVCVDGFENGVPTGTFYNAYRGAKGVPFRSTMEFLLQMEQALDEMNFPQPFCAARSFAQPPAAAVQAAEIGAQSGKKATFVVKVLFRQNASWQGSVSWLEGKTEQSFRSVLELLLLMNSALEGAE